MQATEAALSLSQKITQLKQSLCSRIVGQDKLITRMLIALLSDGHLLVEGAPGLAKTKAIKTLADHIAASFHRVQFTPDLLPGDITGTDIYRVETGEFVFQPGPIFHSVVLADEINRAPAKVQSALLEAMAERQVSIGKTTHPLPLLFLVMATQNPIEQEGTYPLPEAQLDRFLMYVKIDYPDRIAEREILRLVRAEKMHHQPAQSFTLSESDIFGARNEILRLHMSDALEEYLVQLIDATRHPARFGDDIAKWIEYGAGPRGTIGLANCARAHAWLEGRHFVSPEDIHAIVHDVLRHRILVSFEAQAQGMTSDDIITTLLERVAVP